MKNDLSCEVVCDILPLYVDSLVSKTTKNAVDSHIEECIECRNKLDTLKSTDILSEEIESKKIDFLKLIKKNGRKNIIISGFTVAIIIISIIFIKLFIVGEQITDISGVAYSVKEVENNKLEINVESIDSGTKFVDHSIYTENGITNINGRKVLDIGKGYNGCTFCVDNTEKIYLFNILIWDRGTEITKKAYNLYDEKRAYMGDIVGLNLIANILNIGEECGIYTNTLQSSNEPYEWILEFTEIRIKDIKAFNYKMEKNAFYILALVDNLGIVSWTYIDENGDTVKKSVSTQDANSVLPQYTSLYNEKHSKNYKALNIKEYKESPTYMQQLINIIE